MKRQMKTPPRSRSLRLKRKFINPELAIYIFEPKQKGMTGYSWLLAKFYHHWQAGKVQNCPRATFKSFLSSAYSSLIQVFLSGNSTSANDFFSHRFFFFLVAGIELTTSRLRPGNLHS